MFRSSEKRFKRFSSVLRYLYFLVSGIRLKTYREWKSEGEPNPFATTSRRNFRFTSRIEITEMFFDSLRGGPRK